MLSLEQGSSMGAGGDRAGLFGDLLRRSRLSSGLTQEELGRRAGLSVRAISDLERGKTARPRLRSVGVLAGALGLSPAARDRLARAAQAGGPGAAGSSGPAVRGGIAGRDGAQGSGALVVAQLPADVADFTGREGLVQELCRRLGRNGRTRSPGAVVVSVVAGQGGIGKTSVAVHTAHRMASRFPDGRLFVSLRGASAHPLTPAEVLARFLRGLGVDGSAIPPSEQERAAAYRSVLAGRRMLIVLDDARDAAQVRPLLPGRAGCAVLVTSRSWLADLDSAVMVELEVLSRAEAHALFAQIVGKTRVAAEPAAVAAVLDACAGLPLAIRIAAARLAKRPAWPVGGLAGRLADERQRLGELAVGDRAVRAGFQVSYAALPSPPGARGVDPARAFRLLGLWEGKDLSLLAAAALLGRPAEVAEGELDVLLDVHLLGAPEQRRYRFHDLLRVFAAEQAREQESGQAQDEAMCRLLAWYLHTTAAAAHILVPVRQVPAPGRPAPTGELPVFGTYGQAMGWCDDELANLVTATDQAARCGLHEIAWKLPVAAWGFFDLRKHWAEWITTHRVALASARRLGDRYGEAWVLNNLGIAHGQQLQFTEAIEYLEKSLELRRLIGDRRGEGWTLNNIGNVLFHQGQYQESIGHHERALAIRREIGDRYGEATSLNNLGDAYGQAGLSSRAIEYLQKALAIRHAIGDWQGESEAMEVLAGLFSDIGEYGVALEWCGKSLKIAQEIGDRFGAAESLDRMGNVLSRSGHPGRARESLEQALTLYRKLGHPNAARVQTLLGRLSGERAQSRPS